MKHLILFEKYNKIEAYRYYTSLNRYSDIIRGGTFYSTDNSGERYLNNNKNIKIGGDNKIEGYFIPKNPLIIYTQNGNMADLNNVFEYTHIKPEIFRDFLETIVYEKSAFRLNKIIRNSEFILNKDMLLKQQLFNKKQMIIENYISNYMKNNNHDIAIIKNKDNQIKEIFDVSKSFVEK